MEALSLPAPPPSLWSRLLRGYDLHRSRRDLRALDAHMLRDIGLTRAQAEAEARRPLWDAPDHWQTTGHPID